MVWIGLNQQNLRDELVCWREVVGEVNAEVLFAFAVVVDVGEFGTGVDLIGLTVLLTVDGDVAVFEELAVTLGADEELEGIMGFYFAWVGGDAHYLAIGVDSGGVPGLDYFLEFFLGGFGFTVPVPQSDQLACEG